MFYCNYCFIIYIITLFCKAFVYIISGVFHVQVEDSIANSPIPSSKQDRLDLLELYQDRVNTLERQVEASMCWIMSHLLLFVNYTCVQRLIPHNVLIG